MAAMSPDLHLPLDPPSSFYQPPQPLACEGCHTEAPFPQVRLAFVGAQRDTFFLCEACAASAGATYPTAQDYAHKPPYEAPRLVTYGATDNRADRTVFETVGRGTE